MQASHTNILALVDLVLTIPASSAEAERGFNRVKVAKSDWRGKLGDAHLSDQMMIMMESASVLQFDPLPAINVWISTPRRIREETAVLPATVTHVTLPATTNPAATEIQARDLTEGASSTSTNAEPNTAQATVPATGADVNESGTENEPEDENDYDFESDDDFYEDEEDSYSTLCTILEDEDDTE